MIKDLDNITETELLQWIKSSIKTESNLHSLGYQSNVYLYEGKGKRLIIKTPIGWGLGRFVRTAMLRKEYRVYARLSQIQGTPRCYGLLDGRYLVLEYIGGTPMQSAEITNWTVFFDSLLKLIKELHKAGVAHTDLKKKTNLLVVEGKLPYIIDFGVAIIRKPGLAPLNHYLYNLASKFDFNAYVKLKYDRNYENMSDKDKGYYNRTIVEKVARRIRENKLYSRIFLRHHKSSHR
jgi:tRNA A-37 threonylcarbamoyl transferase component Bud32